MAICNLKVAIAFVADTSQINEGLQTSIYLRNIQPLRIWRHFGIMNNLSERLPRACYEIQSIVGLDLPLGMSPCSTVRRSNVG
jgi:hypothetical protein